ncbi:MAG: hypothetical protein AAGF86_20220 [Pseudomonadota bacterium]
MEPVVVVGADDPFTSDVLETLNRLSIEVVAGVMTAPPGWNLAPLQIVLQDEEVSDLLAAHPAVLGSNAPRTRRRAQRFAARSGFAQFPAIVDPTAVVASNARVSKGAYLNALSVVGGQAVLGPYAIVNRGASLGHHSVAEDYAMLGPGSVVGSNCRICEGATLGAGAVVRPGAIVGPGAVVGAGAVVVKDVEANAIVVGNPAHTIKHAPAWSDEEAG